MTDSCCGSPESKNNTLNHTQAIQNRYGSAAIEKESCLCTPVSFNEKYLDSIPKDVIDRDYGCGDPTKYVKKNDVVLDLGSGSGKNAFICAQIVGRSGKVIGVDQNKDMLNLSRGAIEYVANKIGYKNTEFIKGSIEKLDELNNKNEPIIKTSSIDIILSNCVLNLVNPKSRKSLLKNIKRVLNVNGRIAISDIVSNKKVPLSLQNDPDLWSGCISGAWYEPELISDFREIGFKNLKFSERSSEPWKIIEDIEFRTVTLVGNI
tara:strand:+ start:256 stop:1044 length:789 start_codon:yes stop_codon:yes gene_type:complete